MLTLGSRTVLTPNQETLKQMFGDTLPISHFAETDYNEKMLQASSNKEIIIAICDYAERLHKTQSEYDRISPYGGEDVTVQMVDEIALNKVFETFKEETLPEACALLRNELNVRDIDLIYTENIIKSYSELQMLPQKLEREYADYQFEKSEFERKVQNKTYAIQRQGKLELSDYENQFNKLQNSSIKRLLGKISWTRTHKNMMTLESLIDEARNNCNISKDEVIAGFFKDEAEYLSYAMPSYCSNINPDMITVIESESDLISAVRELQEQILNPKNKEVYERCIYFYQIPTDNLKEKTQTYHKPKSRKSKNREADFAR